MALLTMAYLIIDAGGTYLKTAILNSEGEVLKGSSSSVESFSDGSREDILNAFAVCFEKGLKFIQTNSLVLKGIGIAFPGPFDFEKGIPLMRHKFGSIYGLELSKEFVQIAGVSSRIPIKFMHDVNAVLEAGLENGHARDYKNVALVTLGTGLGFSYCINRVVQCNLLGSPLKAIYNQPYQGTILEEYISKRGILRIYNERSEKLDIGTLEVSDIASRAEAGDKASLETFAEVGRILASSLKEFLEEKKIECLLFSGQISRSFHLMEQSLKDGLYNVDCLKKISKVKSIDAAALTGAFLNIIKQAI
jgi:glucokinase